MFGDELEPFFGNGGRQILARRRDDPLEHRAEDLVEAVKLAFVMNEDAAAEVVKLLGFGRDDFGVERLGAADALQLAGIRRAAAIDKAKNMVNLCRSERTM